MKVCIEPIQVTGPDGQPVRRYDVVTAEGHTVRLAGQQPFPGSIEAWGWAKRQHVVMDIPRLKPR